MQSIYKVLKFNFGKTLLAAVLLIAGMQSGYGQCSTVILQEISPVNLCSGTEKTLTPTISGRTAGSGNFIQSGTNGAAIDCNCPEGYVAVGYKGKAGNGVLAQWSLACQKMNRNGTLDNNIVYTQSTGTAAGFDLAPIIASNSALTQIDAYAYTSNYVSLVQGQATPISSIISGTPVGTSYLNPLGQSSTHQLGSSAAPPGCVITGITTGNTGFASGFKVNYKPMAYFTGSFLWSTGDTTAAITITQPAAYTVTYTNRFNCAGVSNTINVLVDTVTITAGGNTTLCQGDSVMLAASPGSSYQWSTGETTQSIMVKTPGNYSVTHGGLCSANQVVTYGTPTTILLNGPSTICPGSSVTLTAQYGSAFIWSTGETTASITVSAAGTYTVTATVNNSCGMQVASQLINVAPLEIPTFSAPYTGLAFCNFNGSVEIWVGANPRYAGYTWSSNVAYTSALRDIAGVGGPGTYSVTVNDVFGCTVPGSIDITGPIDSSAFFGEGVWRVSAWQGGDGTAGAGAWHDNYAGYYIDTVFSINTTDIWDVWHSPGDAPGYNGCHLYGGNPLSYSSKRHGFPCGLYRLSIPQAAGTTQLLVDGILVWTNGYPGDGTPNAWTGILDATSFVEYRTAVAYDESYQMLDFSPETTSSILTSGATIVCSGQSLALSSSISGASYFWSIGETTRRISVSQGGTYSVTVSGNGCTVSEASITINQSAATAPVATLSASASASCSFDPITLSCSAADHYRWNTGDTVQSITVGTSGKYVVIVTNAFGCQDSSDVYVLTRNLTPAMPTAGVAGATCTDAGVTLTASGLAPGGQVLDFGNNDDGRSVQVMQDLPEHNFTIEMWVKTTSANCGIYSVTNGGSDHDRHLYLNNGQLWCRVWTADGWNSGVTLNDGSWHHIALTVADGVGQKIYVDGISAPNSSSFDHSEFNWQDRFMLGYSVDARNPFFKGSMDNVRIWSRALDVSELRGNMTLETPLDNTGLIYHATLNGTLNSTTGSNGTGNGPIAYGNAGFYTYSWTGPGAPSPSTNESQTTSALTVDGTYGVVASAGACNSQAATVNVTLAPAAIVTAHIDKTTICAGETATITATGNAVNYTWSNGAINGQTFFPVSTATYTVTGVTGMGCSATSSVSINVVQPVSATITTSICAGENYAGHTTAGTYTDHYTSAGGCDSARTLVLSVIPTATSTISVSTCEGESYEGYFITGTYTDHFTSAAGCDSVRTLVLIVRPTATATISATICQGENYAGHTTTGTYSDHYTSAGGCDSSRTLVLSVIPVSASTIPATICAGENYAGHTTTGTYTDHYTNAGGCDSTRTLVLTVIPVTSSTVSATICEGETYEGYAIAGTYTDHFTNAGGCDSARTLVLSVIPAVTATIAATICDGENYAGHTTAGTFTDHFTSAAGCDSARTLVLSVLPTASSTVSGTICEGENYEGHTTAGTFTDHFISAAGCDSARTLVLSVLPTASSTVSGTICEGENYEGYSTGGTYTDHFTSVTGCDNTRTLVLTVTACIFYYFGHHLQRR